MVNNILGLGLFCNVWILIQQPTNGHLKLLLKIRLQLLLFRLSFKNAILAKYIETKKVQRLETSEELKITLIVP